GRPVGSHDSPSRLPRQMNGNHVIAVHLPRYGGSPCASSTAPSPSPPAPASPPRFAGAARPTASPASSTAGATWADGGSARASGDSAGCRSLTPSSTDASATVATSSPLPGRRFFLPSHFPLLTLCLYASIMKMKAVEGGDDNGAERDRASGRRLHACPA